MVFKRFVEVGRLCVVSYGPLTGDTCVIVDVVDQNSVVVDSSPRSRVPRGPTNLKRLDLTDFKLALPRGCKTTVVQRKMAASDAEDKFAASSWGRKIARQRQRAKLTDFDRFKVMIARKKRSELVQKEITKLRRKNTGSTTV